MGQNNFKYNFDWNIAQILAHYPEVNPENLEKVGINPQYFCSMLSSIYTKGRSVGRETGVRNAFDVLAEHALSNMN